MGRSNQHFRCIHCTCSNSECADIYFQLGVSNHWTGIWNGTMEWKMEWNSERTQLQVTHVTVAAQSRLNYPVYLQACYLTAEALWASRALPSVMLLYASMVPLLAHHQMLCDCSLAKPGPRTENRETRVWLHETLLRRLTWLCVLMAEISARSSVSSLHSLSVQLDPRSLLGLTTLV